jgi:rhodanese-related sulfurtransferase
MSWNATRRAALYGYRHVAWYPEGTDGWTAAGNVLVPAVPAAGAP